MIGGVLWLTVLALEPEIRKRILLRLLIGRNIYLRTWIQESDRHELLLRRLDKCKRDEVVKLITITGKSILVPDVAAGRTLQSYEFPNAVDRGTIFEGILLDPICDEAVFRARTETPNTPIEESLLRRDADDVKKLPNTYKQA